MSSPALPPLVERTDIHKSCKSLEAVVNLLNDYCEAAGAVVQLQKKLAKSVRDVANLKITPEYAANAFGSCATLLEALSDVDNKFAKVSDKECEGLSSDIRKWFKKLAKEEKAHDDRMAQASARIKQAGLSYEKKTKKNPREAADEHSRYLALVGTLGPEMTQDKYNHAVFVSQRHSITTMNVAACLARIADAEWLRSCENVRRFAPTVGQLGEWRAYCEGGWTGQRPRNLPSDNNLRQPSWDQRQTSRPNSRADDRPPSAVETRTPASGILYDPSPLDTQQLMEPMTPLDRPRSSPIASSVVSRQTSPAHLENAEFLSRSENIADPAATPSQEPESPRRTKRSTTSLAHLAAFPTPPTHFPIPAVTTPTGHKSSASISGHSTPSLINSGSESSARSPRSGPRTPAVSFAAMPSVSESPQLTSEVEAAQTPMADIKPTTPEYPFPQTKTPTEEPVASGALSPLVVDELSTQPKDDYEPHPQESNVEPPNLSEPLSPSDTGTTNKESSVSGSQSGHTSGVLRRGDYLNEREFGVERPAMGHGSKSMDASKSKGMLRHESTHSSGSVVAAMRGRYSHSTTPASPPPRDLPKLAQSVNEIASKYRSSDIASPTPLRRTTSPPIDLTMANHAPSSYRLADPYADSGSRPQLSASTSSRTDLASSTSSLVDDFARRRQRLDELEELELREREYELRQKGREIEQRTRELERERVRITNARTGPSLDGYTSDGTSGRPRGDQLPPVAGLSRGRYSSSTTHIALPSVSSSRDRTSSVAMPASGPTDHAPYCGCAACSAAKYGRQDQSPSAHDLRPPEPPINLRPQPDKPKGWMRRLSMPVGAAFSLNDSKKTPSPGLNRNSMSFVQEEDERSVRRGFDSKSPGNRSVTNFARR